MTKTKYYDLQMDDPQDDYDVEVVNANLKKIDEQMKTRENATDALQEPEFTVADKRENIASKEKMPKILGKIAKFFADLKNVAFTGSYKDLTDRPLSLPANGGNASTVNRHTVDSDVPANAKFTDTNTWRGVQDNLTSSATDQSLSANQGKKLKGLLDGKAALNHNHAYPGGFAGTDAMNWGVQTGSAVCGWSDGAGGSIGFRKNCPENGKVSMVIDGTVYTNEGKDQVLTTGNWSNYAAAKNHSHTVDSAMSSTSANPVQNKVVNNALEKKLDAAKVANNLTTNVAGYALDARQGKELQDQLTALNGSLNNKADIVICKRNVTDCNIDNEISELQYYNINYLFTSNLTTGNLVDLVGEHLLLIKNEAFIYEDFIIQTCISTSSGKVLATRTKPWWLSSFGNWNKIN